MTIQTIETVNFYSNYKNKIAFITSLQNKHFNPTLTLNKQYKSKVYLPLESARYLQYCGCGMPMIIF